MASSINQLHGLLNKSPYFGYPFTQAFTPLSTRRALLEQKFGEGFCCGCSRCKAEERHPSVASAVEKAYDTAQKLSEAWVEAHDNSDSAAAGAVRDQIKVSGKTGMIPDVCRYHVEHEIFKQGMRVGLWRWRDK